MLSRFHIIPKRHGQTDGRTDWWTDRFAISIWRVSMLETNISSGLIARIEYFLSRSALMERDLHIGCLSVRPSHAGTEWLTTNVVVVVVVIVRKACTRRHNYRITIVCRHLGCPYANKNVFSNRRNSPSSVSGRRSDDRMIMQFSPSGSTVTSFLRLNFIP